VKNCKSHPDGLAEKNPHWTQSSLYLFLRTETWTWNFLIGFGRISLFVSILVFSDKEFIVQDKIQFHKQSSVGLISLWEFERFPDPNFSGHLLVHF